MSSTYPVIIDSSLNLPTVTDNFSSINAAVINRLRDAIVNTEAELGVKPSGTYGTVRARLDALELNGDGPSDPTLSVQFNNDGVFGGSTLLYVGNSQFHASDAYFTYGDIFNEIYPPGGLIRIRSPFEADTNIINARYIETDTNFNVLTLRDNSVRIGDANAGILITGGPNTIHMNTSSISLASSAGNIELIPYSSVFVGKRNEILEFPSDGIYLWVDPDVFTLNYTKPDNSSIILNGFVASGDLSGDESNQIVTGLQTYDVVNTAPIDGYVLTWLQADGYWAPRSTEQGYRLTEIASAVPAASAAGDNTVGIQFFVNKNGLTCSGVRFYWAVSGSKNVKVQLWNAGGSSLANITISVSSTGIQTAMFSLPISLTTGVLYRVSAYQTDASNYTKSTLSTADIYIPSRPFYAGLGLVITSVVNFVSGDAHPTGTSVTEAYHLEPILL